MRSAALPRFSSKIPGFILFSIEALYLVNYLSGELHWLRLQR